MIVFKEWLPDLPELGNPGLIQALNILPSNDGYVPFNPLDDSGGTAPGSVLGAFVANGSTKGSSRLYIAAGGRYYSNVSSATAGNFSTRGSLTPDDAAANFAQYENKVFAAGGDSHRLAQITLGAITSGGGSGFVEVTAAPYADVVGVVGQHLVVGAIYDDAAPITVGAIKANYVQWSSIDQPVQWPTPGSSTAIASQAGEQSLYEEYGRVMAIHGGDQYAVILQSKAVTRMTYIGGTAVFQFDLIDSVHGSRYPKGSVKVGALVYFISPAGFCRTDGVRVERIGSGKVDKAWDALTATSFVSAAFDPWNELVVFGNGAWTFNFNPLTSWWTVCQQGHVILFTPGINPSQPQRLRGFNASNVLGNFAATAGTAVITTGEVEFAPGRYSHIAGVKPLVSGTESITVAVGTRNDQDTTPSFTSEVAPTTRTGFSDFRSEARYHRARVTITGAFTKAIGVEPKLLASSET